MRPSGASGSSLPPACCLPMLWQTRFAAGLAAPAATAAAAAVWLGTTKCCRPVAAWQTFSRQQRLRQGQACRWRHVQPAETAGRCWPALAMLPAQPPADRAQQLTRPLTPPLVVASLAAEAVC